MKLLLVLIGALVTAISTSAGADWSNPENLSRLPGKTAYAVSDLSENGTRSIQLAYACDNSRQIYFLLADFPVPTRIKSGVEFAQTELTFDGEAITVNLFPGVDHLKFGETWAIKDGMVESSLMTIKLDWTDFEIDMTGSAKALFSAYNKCH